LLLARTSIAHASGHHNIGAETVRVLRLSQLCRFQRFFCSQPGTYRRKIKLTLSKVTWRNREYLVSCSTATAFIVTCSLTCLQQDCKQLT
jgi:hypothetical protein